ncbi:hypothetical protein DUT91_22900 [Phyllobacterium salinisoli]|uniref:Uncharacterized protein n=1 Tax=Phyllobacterium salinisoli TaxID=1899321 RepID=A0A368JWT8_9HYPH|nr:hypothetical protein DUT91_22900 [Phyllobacterium salinisoli]
MAAAAPASAGLLSAGACDCAEAVPATNSPSPGKKRNERTTAPATTTANTPASATYRTARQTGRGADGSPASGSSGVVCCEAVSIRSWMDWRVIWFLAS